MDSPGAKRNARTSYRWRDLLDAGVRINNGTDAPVEDIDPFSYAASGADHEQRQSIFPGTRDDPIEALRSYTLQCLLCLRGRHQRLPVGKLADLAVLSDNLLTAPDAELNIQVDYLGWRTDPHARTVILQL